MRRFKGAQHVRRSATRANAKQHIPRFAKRLNLARKNILEFEVIYEAREERCVGGERERRQGWPHKTCREPAGKFCGKVLAIGRAAAVAAQQQFAAGA